TLRALLAQRLHRCRALPAAVPGSFVECLERGRRLGQRGRPAYHKLQERLDREWAIADVPAEPRVSLALPTESSINNSAIKHAMRAPLLRRLPAALLDC